MIPPMVQAVLEQDPLQNLVTLKMLHLHAAHLHFHFNHDEQGWALLTLLPSAHSDWDRNMYPHCTHVAFINGTSASAKVKLLRLLPKPPFVLKIADAELRAALPTLGKVSKAVTFHSFTTNPSIAPQAPDPEVQLSTAPSESALEMFRSNGYSSEELAHHFQSGAKWFGIHRNGDLASTCFIFQNHEQIWEIAGVFTDARFRRQYLAQKVVMAALHHLASNKLTPRYQCRADNPGSLHLAKSCNLVEFLQMDHYVIDPQ